MSWKERLKQAAFTSAGGDRLTFQYEDVSKEVERKTTAYNFAGADGTYIQDLGNTGNRFPLLIYFWGTDYDTRIEEFEKALLQPGIGVLEHPLYGVRNVVPFGVISRRDNLVTAANQGILEVTFWETITQIYPGVGSDPASLIEGALSDYATQEAARMEKDFPTEPVVEVEIQKNSLKEMWSQVKSGLQKVADFQADVQRQFNDIYTSVTDGIDTIIGQPTTIAFQTLQLIQAPGRALGNLKASLDGYANLINDLIDGDLGDDLAGRDLNVSGAISGSVVAAINADIQTKTEALLTAETILEQFATVTTWRDNAYNTAGVLDTSESYAALQNLVALTVGYLVDVSFTLKTEKSIITDRARATLDLCYELYGNVDDNLDFFISSNALSGSEILEIPRGREILYYI